MNELYGDKGWSNSGWVCPKCGRVMAPWMAFCPCYEEGSKVQYTTDTTTTTPTPHWLKDIYNNQVEEQHKHIRDYMTNPQIDYVHKETTTHSE